MAKIAFYCPIKPLDHHIPCGILFISNNLVKALKTAGHEVRIATKYITYMKSPDMPPLTERKSEALSQAQNILEQWENEDYKPDLFFTYHPYDKAPDWIGSTIAESLNIPYLTAEACQTGQINFEKHKNESQQVIRKAQGHLCLKPADKEYLISVGINKDLITPLLPFIDTQRLPINSPTQKPKNEPPIFVATGMMRPGKKTLNYKILSQVFRKIIDQPWKLVLIGDGPKKSEIQNDFKDIPQDKLHWAGLCDQQEVFSWLQRSTAFVWPGWKEPIGMVFLEAAAMGKPTLAYHSMGVPLVVEHDRTGFLAPEDDIIQYSKNVTRLIHDPALAQSMGEQARIKVANEHSLEAAANRISKTIRELLSK